MNNTNKTFDTDPIEEFLAQAEAGLGRGLPPERLAATLAEARGHLTQRAEDLEKGGLPPNAARATSVAGFGPPQEWVKDILLSADAGQGARTAGIVSGVAFTLLLLIPLVLWIVSTGLSSGPNISGLTMMIATGSSLAVLVSALLVALMGAFRARRCAVPSLALIVAAMAVVSLLIGDCIMFRVPGHGLESRETARAWNAMVAEGRGRVQAEAVLLRLGVKAYAGSALPARVPPVLQTSDGYLAPTEQDPPEEYQYVIASVPDRMEAARRWQVYGAMRLAAVQAVLDGPKPVPAPEMVAINAALKDHPHFDAAAGIPFAAATAAEGAVLLALCWLAARAGARFRRLPRRWVA